MTTQGKNPSSTVEAVAAAAAVCGFFLFSYLNFFIFGPSTQRSMCVFYFFFLGGAPSSRESRPRRAARSSLRHSSPGVSRTKVVAGAGLVKKKGIDRWEGGSGWMDG